MTEQARHELYEALKEAIGIENAATLMDAIPPVGWADVVTKRDLDNLAALTKRDISVLANELRAEWRLEARNLVLAMVATNSALAALAFAAARLV